MPPSPPHILKDIKPNAKGFNREEAVQKCHHWLMTEFATKNCKRLSGTSHRHMKCKCMRFLEDLSLEDLPNAVSEYMVHWASLSRSVKMELLNEWKQQADFISGIAVQPAADQNLLYRLPTRGLPAGRIAHHSICRNALCGLLFVGRKLWQTAMKDGAHRVHGLNGKSKSESSRGKEMNEVYESLDSFFTDLLEEGLPFATRIVRDETGTTTRDDDPDDILLPPHITKYSCYARWCFLRGWKIEKESSAKTILKSTKQYTKRSYEQIDEDGISMWPPGSAYKKIVSWPSFLNYWKNNFNRIKIRKKGADTCTDCLILMNEFRSQRRIGRGTVQIGVTRDTDDESSNSDMSISSNDDDTNIGDEREFERTVANMDATIAKAKAHVRAYQVQQDESKKIIKLARLDITNHLPSLFCRKVLTIDMGQNLNIPNFKGEQPRDTYYMSPLTVLLFGVVNNATQDGFDRMNAYVWQEFEGDRGANNIALCLLMDLKKRGWLTMPNYGELTYIADNCGGQNKNKVVIRFLMWLVENGIFPQVKIFFLVKGHTKNAADHLFNLLKLSYHCKNIYTYDQLCENLNENEYVDVHRMKKEDFRDHLEWQDKYYRTPTGGEFKQSHVFTIYGSGRYKRKPTILVKQDDNSAVFRDDDLAPTNKSRKAAVLGKQERAEQIKRMELDLKELVPSGLKPIKQVELWKKWRPLVPEWARDITCAKPSEEVIQSIKDRNRKKSADRSEDKKRHKTEGERANKNPEIFGEDID